MDEERCQIKRKGKIISLNKHFMIVCQNHVQTLDNEKKSALSMLHFAFSKKSSNIGPNGGCATQKNAKKCYVSKSKNETKAVPKLSPLID